MWNPFRREQPVVAAASVADKSGVLDKASVMARDINEAWQTWRLLGEIHYTTAQQSRLVSRVAWDVVLDGKQLEQEQSNDVLRAAFGKNLRDLIEQMAIHLQVAGGYYFVRRSGQWHVLPNPPDHKAKLVIADSDIIVLNKNPDPRDPSRTDSPVLAALDVSRELILARAQSRAASRNRTAQLNTVLYPLEGAGPDPDKFEKDFTRVMAAPLINELAESVVVPNLVGFQGDWIEKWKTMDLTGPVDKYLHEKIPMLIKQLAIILDHPPQLLLGMEDLNHWAAWAVQEDNWFGHVEPLGRRIGDGIALALAKATDVDEDALEIIPDPAPLLKRRPSVDNIIEAYKEGIVSGEFARPYLGADEDDAPADDDPNAKGSSGSGEEEEGPPATEQGDDKRAVAAAAPLELASSVTPDPRILAEIDNQVYDSVEDLIVDTGDRALQVLGARIRSASQGRDPGVNTALNNIQLALQHEGPIPNQDEVITSTALGALPRLDRAVDRAYDRLNSLGIDVKPDELEQRSGQDLFKHIVAEHVGRLLDGRAGIEWSGARRICSVTGGAGDLAVVASTPIRTTDTGIALGPRSLAAIQTQFNVTPGVYVWLHQTRGSNEHPTHRELDGERFNGRFILQDGVNWFPGDHDGCRCIAMPEFVRVG